jgi:hypothetical protein
VHLEVREVGSVAGGGGAAGGWIAGVANGDDDAVYRADTLTRRLGVIILEMKNILVYWSVRAWRSRGRN